MKIKKAFKFKLKTNKELERKLVLFAGHCRFVWNYFWKLNQYRLNNGYWVMKYNEMDFFSKVLKKSDEYGFLAEAPAHLLQQKLKDLDKAYSDAFDKKQKNKRLPTKRKRQLHNSFRFPDAKQFCIENRRIKLPKLGWIGFHKSRNIEGTPKNITVSYKSGSWYMSVQTEIELDVQQAPESSIGLDVGVSKFVTYSTLEYDGFFKPINSYRSYETRLTKEQRKLSRKTKFSNNWKKQNLKIQKLHSKIANTRKDYLHNISNEISKNHAKIYIEDLQIRNMSKSSKGNIEKPGKMVKQKAGLNKSILDQSWYEFRRQLEYKSSWHGGKVIAIDPKYTSQTCSDCGFKSKENRETQSKFVCKNCGFELNADGNASRNILAVGRNRFETAKRIA